MGTAEVFWRIIAFQHGQRVAPKSGYWFNNQKRDPTETVALQYSEKGTLIYGDRNGQKEVPAGNAVLFHLDEDSYYGVPDTASELYVCSFYAMRGAGLREHCEYFKNRFGPVIHLGGDAHLLREWRKLAKIAHPRTNEEAALGAIELHRFFMRLGIHMEQSRIQSCLPVERAVDELLAFPTQPWSLKEVASRHGCSREHLTRVFSERVGLSPGAFLAKARLAKALELLQETGLAVGQVAEQSGFVSQHTLARWVRRATGLSPGAHRRHFHGGPRGVDAWAQGK